jgi:hypothetical protein
MAPDEERKDPQDQEFGAQAAADQEPVDELDADGIEEEELPDSPEKAPRAAGKAELASGGGD